MGNENIKQSFAKQTLFTTKTFYKVFQSPCSIIFYLKIPFHRAMNLSLSTPVIDWAFCNAPNWSFLSIPQLSQSIFAPVPLCLSEMCCWHQIQNEHKLTKRRRRKKEIQKLRENIDLLSLLCFQLNMSKRIIITFYFLHQEGNIFTCVGLTVGRMAQQVIDTFLSKLEGR